ncbi:MAG TPA: hypothetical protein VD757_01780 [Candidatus Nitrosocosmicus sp.]|nr:hypothetical protein [Candidatus Nitrosocosmicus sp.]
MQQTAGYRPVMYGLKQGDKVEHIQIYKRGTKVKRIPHVCTVVSESLWLITLQAENYKITVDKRDIGKNVELYRLEDEVMNHREPKITAEQLLEECKVYGTEKAAEKIIAEKYGLKPLTVKTYIVQWKIKEKLKAEKQPDVAETAEEAKKKSQEELIEDTKWAPAESVAESKPKHRSDLLRIKHIEVTGEIYDYQITQGGIQITDSESRSQTFTISDFDEMIQELQAAKAAHINYFGGTSSENKDICK